MPKDDSVYLGHMLDTAREARELVLGIDRSAYQQDRTLKLALAHLIQVLGEAARQVSDEIQSSHPAIPWEDIIGMRHKIVHDYLAVDEDIVWEVVATDLPSLIPSLERIIPSETF